MQRRRRKHRVPLWSRRNRELTSRQRARKAKFLRSLSLARRGRGALEDTLREQEITPSEALARTDAVKLVRGKLTPKVRDRIPRWATFYEKGKLRHAEIADSRVASDIGRYLNAIKDLTETGSSRALRNFGRQRFKDLHGRFHTLEKDPRLILQLEARKPIRELLDLRLS